MQSILAWITQSGIRDENGDALDYSSRLFWLPILADWSNEICIKGAAQVGKSISFSLKVVYAMKFLGWPVIYTFPTEDDVREFVTTKMNKVIEANREAIGNMDTENVQRKEIGGVFAHFKGLKSDTAAIATTARLVIHDEASRSSQVALKTMESRSKSVEKSKRYRWLFSNPTVERDLLDLEWRRSDRKEWHVTCPSCGDEHRLSWPESIDRERKAYVCRACRADLPDEARRKGRWIATAQGEVSGYHLSHLMCDWITAAEIIKDADGDPEYFNNFVLGEPYSPSIFEVTRGLLLDAWTPENLATGKWYLGVDVGTVKHYVLGSERGITKVGRFGAWSELDDIIRQYDPYMVIDAMPENEVSRAWVERNPKASMCYLGGKDKESNLVVRWGKDAERGVIKADRNRLIDRTIGRLQQGEMMMNLPADAMYRLLIAHGESLRRVKQVNADGIERYVWESTNGEDHLFFAMMFYDLAREGSSGDAAVLAAPYEVPQAVVATETGFRLNTDEFMRYPREE